MHSSSEGGFMWKRIAEILREIKDQIFELIIEQLVRLFQTFGKKVYKASK